MSMDKYPYDASAPSFEDMPHTQEARGRLVDMGLDAMSNPLSIVTQLALCERGNPSVGRRGLDDVIDQAQGAHPGWKLSPQNTGAAYGRCVTSLRRAGFVAFDEPSDRRYPPVRVTWTGLEWGGPLGGALGDWQLDNDHLTPAYRLGHPHHWRDQSREPFAESKAGYSEDNRHLVGAFLLRGGTPPDRRPTRACYRRHTPFAG